jgi:peptidoglycan/LPS O-acetylase OafA/YrhL
MSKLTATGKISYSIYLLHVPVAMLIKKFVFISDLKTEVIVKYILWITITFALSYLLERVMQPAIKRFFFPKPAIKSSLSGT